VVATGGLDVLPCPMDECKCVHSELHRAGSFQLYSFLCQLHMNPNSQITRFQKGSLHVVIKIHPSSQASGQARGKGGRERQRDRHTHTLTHTHTHIHTHTQRERERERERGRGWERERGGEKQRERERGTLPPQHPYVCGSVMQDFALGALSVLLVDGLSRKALLKEDAGLGTLLTLCGEGPDPDSNACFEARRVMAAQTLASCVQRDPSVRLSLLQPGAAPPLLG
jgi:hypothetical protein